MPSGLVHVQRLLEELEEVEAEVEDCLLFVDEAACAASLLRVVVVSIKRLDGSDRDTSSSDDVERNGDGEDEALMF